MSSVVVSVDSGSVVSTDVASPTTAVSDSGGDWLFGVGEGGDTGVD